MDASSEPTASGSASSSPSPTSSSSPATCRRSPTASAPGRRPRASSRRRPGRRRSCVRLADPWLLLLLGLVVVVLPWGRRASRRPAVRYPTLAALLAVAPAGAAHRRALLGLLRAAALGLLVLALARPQAGSATAKLHREGVDVVLAVDVSGSMLAEDFTLEGKRSSRLDAVKSVVREFVGARPQDRIGLVLFAARPYTQAPLTLDHGWLLQNLARAKVGMIEDGTAVGSALATAVNRLEPSAAKSKIVVLLTDGQSNAGKVTPMQAAEAAKTL